MEYTSSSLVRQFLGTPLVVVGMIVFQSKCGRFGQADRS